MVRKGLVGPSLDMLPLRSWQNVLSKADRSGENCPGTGCGTRKRPGLAIYTCPMMVVRAPEKKAEVGQPGPLPNIAKGWHR